MSRKTTLLLVLLLAPVCALANGIGHHVEIARRALHFYSLSADSPQRELLLKHPDAFQAGAIFPDWGFAESVNPDASGAAHWTPFLEEASRLLRSKPKPWDEATEKLAVFVLGMMTHGLSDLYWHNLDCGGGLPGFLQAMSNQDFSETYSLRSYDNQPQYPPSDPRRAHDIGDAGGMVVDIYQNDPRWATDAFYFPMQDIEQVYEALGRREGRNYGVTRDQLVQATKLMSAAVIAFRRVETSSTLQEIFYRDVYPEFVKRSPFLVERFEDYFAGGTDNSAVLIAEFWPRLTALFEQEPTAEQASRGALYCPERVAGEDYDSGARGTAPSTTAVATHDLTFDGTVGRQVLATAGQLEQVAVAGGVRFVPAGTAAAESLSVRVPAGTDAAYRYTGTALATGRFGGRTQVAIGVPGYSLPQQAQVGGVQVRSVFPDGSVDALIEGPIEGPIDLVGHEPHARFGWALAVVDLNADGRDDLAVGAPTTGASRLQYRGKVYVYFGTARGLAPDPGLILAPERDRANFGWHLNGLDVDGDGYRDLVVGAPQADHPRGGRQAGQVSVYLASSAVEGGAQLAPVWTLSGEHPTDWFGATTALIDAPGQPRRLVVGAPGSKWLPGQRQAAGAVYGYDLSDPRQPRLGFTLRGQSRYGGLGSALAFGNPGTGPVLAVAAPSPSAFEPSEPQRGAVWLLETGDLRGDQRLDRIAAVTHISGDQDLARFGWRLGLTDVNGDGRDDLLITEPQRWTEAGIDAGAVYAWFGGASFPTGSVGAATANWRQFSGEKRARLGSTATVARDGTAIRLLVAAPRSSKTATLGGEVPSFQVSPELD